MYQLLDRAMFNRSQIINMLSKHRAICSCAQCPNQYECNIYDAAKSGVGHLCQACKFAITKMTAVTQKSLLKVFDYDHATGVVTHKWDSISGLRGESAGYKHNEGYLSISIGGKEYLLHRVIWFMVKGEWPTQVDHQDHDRTNNRWSNLRNVSSQVNQMNMKKRKNNSSGVQGVRVLPSGKFCAHIMVNRKQLSLGSYDDLEDAKAARKTAEVMHGFHANHGS